MLIQSVLAGTVPVELNVSAGFDVADLPAAVAGMGSGRRYASLVAAQLAKALSDPAATAALAELDAVLIGGGPCSLCPVLEGAAAVGIAVVRTYGSSETSGGCVYDGVPLDGAQVRLDAGAEPGEGRIAIGGATLAKGYRNPPEPDPFAEPGWFRTDDLGLLDEAGRPGGARSSRRGDQHRRADGDARAGGGGAVAAPGGGRLRGVRGGGRAARRAGGGGRGAGQLVRSSRALERHPGRTWRSRWIRPRPRGSCTSST